MTVTEFKIKDNLILGKGFTVKDAEVIIVGQVVFEDNCTVSINVDG